MAAREEFLGYLREQLVGPTDGERELIEAPPDSRYLMGTLYPQNTEAEQKLTASAEQLENHASAEKSSEENQADGGDPVAGANDWLPSSMGLSFFTDATELRLSCTAAQYLTQRGGGSRRWQREPLPDEDLTFTLGETEKSVFGGRALVKVRWRPFADRQLVTVAMVNAARDVDDSEGSRARTPRWDDMLFQTGFEVRPVDGVLLPYPSVRLTSRDEEEQELRLQYRHMATYAVGHSCAVEELKEDGRAVGARTQAMPEVEVSAIRPSGPSDAPVLKLRRLYSESVPPSRLRQELLDFVGGYRAWYEAQTKAAVPPWGAEAAERILERLRVTVERMEAGVEALFADPTGNALRAFRFANLAMALQMRHSQQDLGGSRRSRADAVQLDPGPLAEAAWHPFQLGFFLLSVRGLLDEGHPDREVVDLIWFPTGGGKTEAYLFLACFEILLRRLRYGAEGGGTAVISRYTLSLLTTQQFQRAAATVCALEYLRNKNEDQIPGDPFSIGLWVGMGTTHNDYAKACAEFDNQRAAAHPKDVFILDRCPWCGTRVMPAAKSPDIADYGVVATEVWFKFFCPRDECHFHEKLPVAVIDDHIYADPPTFVLGTVDKFARLAWEPRARELFGSSGKRPPSLIIQDELHLLTGPLGTTVGLYEAALLQLCAWEGKAPPPKVVASTATIRRANEQIRQMYGRNVQLFPSAGLDARYSYFSEPAQDVPGRKYVGLMAQGHTAGRATAITAAALLQGAMELPEEHRDDYWTLVAYHHSMRELGRTRTAAGDDIPAQLVGLGSEGDRRELPEHQVEELSSNMARADQPELLSRLELSYTDKESVSLVVCTNMLSVGVDVKRLALMLMLGQPKANAEYIQATSRVGRHKVPGLVVTFLNATRSRDRSHYETFGTFHSALYRHVEPTSVTPWSIPSRRRALHAALVILVRHGAGLAYDNQAGEVLNHPEVLKTAAARLLAWVERCDPQSAGAAEADLKALCEQWREEAERAKGKGLPLYYKPGSKSKISLLKNFDYPGGLWETQHSMRNVDRECQMIMKGAE